MKKLASLLLSGILLMELVVPVAAAEPLCITEISASEQSILLAWTDVGADYYEVCRSLRCDGVYVQIAKTSELTYIDSGLTQNTAYFYRIRACRGGIKSAFTVPVGRCCVKITEAWATENRCYRQGQTIRVRGLMLHSIGCAQERAAVIAAGWNSADANVLVHGVIEPGGTVYQLADWTARCWHCGGSGNDRLIGIEMTEPEELVYSGGAAFSYSGDARETAMDNYNTAVALFANLCFIFGLDPMRDIVSHAEAHAQGQASAHADPEHLWNGLSLGVTMDLFRADVARKMTGEYRERTPPPLGAYTVRASMLNVRSGPGTEYAVVGTLLEGSPVQISSIAQENNASWGESPGGWVSMNYVD